MDLYNRVHEYITAKNYIPQKIDELFLNFNSISSYADFYEVIQKLIGEGKIAYIKKDKISSTEAIGYIRGTYKSNAKKFGFFVPDEEYRKRCGGDLYISPENSADDSGFLAVDDDIVLILMKSPVSAGEQRSGEGKIIKIIEHKLKSVIGTLKLLPSYIKGQKTHYYIKSDDRHINFLTLIDNIDNYKIGDKVEANISDYHTVSSDAKGYIVCSFGASDSSEANYNAILHENGIKTTFDANTITEADEVSKEEISVAGRTDLRNKIIFTIDGEDAKDLDDAISVEKNGDNYILGVHIADVSHYVKENSSIDNEALERGTSVYFNDRVIPMLPESLSNGCCSLNADTDKYTLSVFITLNGEGEIIGCELTEAVIKSVVRGVYSELNDLIKNGISSPFIDKYKIIYNNSFSDILSLYDILNKKSIKRGALELETNEAKIIIENGKPVNIIKRERGITERIIEQFMLCANEAVAEWLFWQDMPCVYRIHENPSPEKIQIFSVFAHNLGLNIAPLRVKNIRSSSFAQILEEAKSYGLGSTVSYVMLRSQMKARYSSTSHPHFGLSIDKYCHFTSPIRRYPDLAVHRIVKTVLKGNMEDVNYNKMVSFAENAAKLSSENELKSVSAERDIENLYKTIFMSEQIGKIYDGIISSVTPFGFFVELENTCEGLVPISSLDGYFNYDERSMTLKCGYSIYELGMRVAVVIESADIISRRVEMRIYEKKRK